MKQKMGHYVKLTENQELRLMKLYSILDEKKKNPPQEQQQEDDFDKTKVINSASPNQ